MTVRAAQVEALLGGRRAQVRELEAAMFRPGELVRCVEAGGGFEVGETYRVAGVSGGRWYRLVGPFGECPARGGIGAGRFRVVGACGQHRAGGWTDAMRGRGWAWCGRCGAAMPEHVSHYWMEQAGWRPVGFRV